MLLRAGEENSLRALHEHAEPSACLVRGGHITQGVLLFAGQLKPTGALAIRLAINSYWNELIQPPI